MDHTTRFTFTKSDRKVPIGTSTLINACEFVTQEFIYSSLGIVVFSGIKTTLSPF